jgi:high-affinity nickel permease
MFFLFCLVTVKISNIFLIKYGAAGIAVVSALRYIFYKLAKINQADEEEEKIVFDTRYFVDKNHDALSS